MYDLERRTEKVMNFGRNVRRVRKERGILQKDLADMTDITNTTFVTMEGGKTVPTLLTAVAISEALGVTIDELLEDV